MENIVALVEAALADLAAGKPVLVADNRDRENEIDAIASAATVSLPWMAWMVRHTSGYLCAPMPGEWADKLALPSQVADNQDPRGTAYTVSCDAAANVTTGISAADRRETLRVLANPQSTADNLIRPGHILPLRARGGGIAERPGHTEATVELMQLAGLQPVGVIGELVRDDGQMMRFLEATELAGDYDLVLLTVAELQAYLQYRANGEVPDLEEVRRPVRPSVVKKLAEANLPTVFGDFRVFAYRDLQLGVDHLALVPQNRELPKVPLVRIHSECLTGEALRSLKCDCGPQLEEAMRRVQAEGGVIVYMRGHEGRGIGLGDKIRAYCLQDSGLDTVEANLELGLPVDSRNYTAAADILNSLGVDKIRLLSNNPLKSELPDNVEVVEMVPIEVGFDPHNIDYLKRKAQMGHTFQNLEQTSF